MHVAIDPKTGKLILVETTEEHAHDTTHLEKALDRCNQKKGKVLFDGIADSKRCYKICRKRNKKLLTPPSRKAILRREPEYGLRNDALKIIKGLGGDELARSIWSKLSEYSRRSQIESFIARWKKLLGGRLSSKSLERIKKEVLLKVMILNEMVDQKNVA